jgi:hypothetical protein
MRAHRRRDRRDVVPSRWHPLIAMVVASIYFYERDPQLAERRLQSKEKVGN